MARGQDTKTVIVLSGRDPAMPLRRDSKMEVKDIPNDHQATFNPDVPMERENIGSFAKKADFHENKQKVKIKAFKPDTNQWGKKRFLLTVEDKDKDDLILTISGKNKNQLMDMLGPVFSTDWHNREIFVETIQDTYDIEGEKVDGYEYYFSLK